MTVKELITELLNYDMDKEVCLLADADPEDSNDHTSTSGVKVRCTGVNFQIDHVEPWGRDPQIYFKDWRHERMKDKLK